MVDGDEWGDGETPEIYYEFARTDESECDQSSAGAVVYTYPDLPEECGITEGVHENRTTETRVNVNLHWVYGSSEECSEDPVLVFMAVKEDSKILSSNYVILDHHQNGLYADGDTN